MRDVRVRAVDVGVGIWPGANTRRDDAIDAPSKTSSRAFSSIDSGAVGVGYDDDRLDEWMKEDRSASLSLLDVVSPLRRDRDVLRCDNEGLRKKNARRKVAGSSSACVS